MAIDWVLLGGFACGATAGGGARYGRLCTMSAVEDALVAGDRRGLKAWGLALAVAVAATQGLAALDAFDPDRSLYAGPRLHVLGAALGGVLFGLGMSLVGTCAFGLLVRAGGGDLRAVVSGLVAGIVAMAVTAGTLAPLRAALLDLGSVSSGVDGGVSLDRLLAVGIGDVAAVGLVGAVVAMLLVAPLADRRLRARPRLIVGAVAVGLAVAGGWLVTGRAVDHMLLDRPESLSFVAPVGRAILQLMMEPFRSIGFGVSAAAGVVAASAIVAMLRREVRWEAFDDAGEMRRHLLGATLMAIGGVLAQGCTIGQGLSAASTLSVSAPIVVVGVLLGAKIGLLHLIEGRSMWRLGRPS